jgi:hypothetical protein
VSSPLLCDGKSLLLGGSTNRKDMLKVSVFAYFVCIHAVEIKRIAFSLLFCQALNGRSLPPGLSREQECTLGKGPPGIGASALDVGRWQSMQALLASLPSPPPPPSPTSVPKNTKQRSPLEKFGDPKVLNRKERNTTNTFQASV